MIMGIKQINNPAYNIYKDESALFVNFNTPFFKNHPV